MDANAGPPGDAADTTRFCSQAAAAYAWGHAGASRSRDGAPRPRARPGGRAARPRRGAPPRPALPAAGGLRAAADRRAHRAPGSPRQVSAGPARPRRDAGDAPGHERPFRDRRRDARCGRVASPSPNRPTRSTRTSCFETEAGAEVTFYDPRRFGYMDLIATDALERHPWFAGLGPEPMECGFDAAHLGRAAAGRKAPIKSLLLDQRVIAGLGNIYVCEALHRAGVAPERPAGTVPPRKIKAIAEAIRTVLGEAIEAGGSTLRDYAGADGVAGLLPASLRGLWPRGRALPEARLPGPHRAHRAGRPLELRLQPLPAMTPGAPAAAARTRGLVRRLGALALTAALGLALWLGAGSPAQAKPPIWVVRSPHATLVLFGSIHLLPAGLDWRPREARRRARDSRRAVVRAADHGEGRRGGGCGLAGAWGVAEGQAADRDAQRRRDRAPRPGVDHAALRAGGDRPHAALDGRAHALGG